MIETWLTGLLRRRGGRLLSVSVGIGVAVALIASLGTFLTISQETMTTRALRSVAVDWQVQVQPGADPAAVRAAVGASSGVRAALPVSMARSTGLEATAGGTTQTTGAAVVLGLPDGYRTQFPGEIRQLSGSPTGVLVAQQTASNLHVRPGSQVRIGLGTSRPATVTVAGVVDLPQADSLFQKVGAPTGAQPSAPPDNIILLPAATFAAVLGTPTTTPPSGAHPTPVTSVTPVTTQVHVARSAPLPTDPAAAYAEVLGAAHNLEATLAGTGVVGNNVGAALDAARSDAAYAQMLFLFLGLPGALLAALLTAALVGAGAQRRRDEQALLRTRGLAPRAIGRLAALEAALVAAGGAVLGLAGGALASRWAFGDGAKPAGRTGLLGLSPAWSLVAVLFGALIAGVTVLAPAARDLRGLTVSGARHAVGRARSSWWMRYGLDFAVLGAALVVFWVSSSDNYALVLAPEGVPSISVSYWAFLGPALLWLGGAMLLWRLATVALTRGRRPLARVIAPLTGRLARPAAATMSRRRRPLTRSVVLLALAISFAASTATFNATYQQQAEADAQLTNGADVAVTPAPGAPLSSTATAAIAATPGVTRVEPLQHRFAYVGADLQDLYGVNPGTITSVTSLQDAYFQGGTAAQLMAALAAKPDSILVSDETVKDFQLQPGDLLNLRLEDRTTHQLKTIPFHYAGIAKEFPTAPKDSFFIANADYVTKATGSNAVGTYLVDTSGTNQAAVAADLRRALGSSASVTDVTQTRAAVGSSLTSVNLAGLTRLELAFAVILAAGSGGLVLAIGLAERRRTMAIISVLGARRRQLQGLVMAEASVVAVGGLLGGAVISWALTQMLVKVLTGVFDPPPASVAVPAVYLAATVLTVVLALAAAAAFSARTSTRPAVEELRDL
ncbi:FtsX-like permease family protein [Terrabacter sp. Ter38]|uniref:ABC transporter permease n=1 Tax=Terrabacter sp. Ter38 TaxID=2926030 RepID=UPI002117C924|nr:FtsX-like permease family protein [Terrabacter sp. Ter38]